MKKNGLTITLIVGACALAVTSIFKSCSIKKEDENSIDKTSAAPEKEEGKKENKKDIKTKNKNIVKVNNSLVSIKVKLFSS